MVHCHSGEQILLVESPFLKFAAMTTALDEDNDGIDFTTDSVNEYMWIELGVQNNKE